MMILSKIQISKNGNVSEYFLHKKGMGLYVGNTLKPWFGFFELKKNALKRFSVLQTGVCFGSVTRFAVSVSVFLETVTVFKNRNRKTHVSVNFYIHIFNQTQSSMKSKQSISSEMHSDLRFISAVKFQFALPSLTVFHSSQWKEFVWGNYFGEHCKQVIKELIELHTETCDVSQNS